MSENVVNIADRPLIRYCLVLDHPKIRKTVIFAELLSSVLADLQAQFPDRPEWATTWADDPLLTIQALCPFNARPLFRSRDFPDLFRSLVSLDPISNRMHIEVSESTSLETSFGFTVSGDGAALFEEGIDGCVAEVWEYGPSAADARMVATGVVSGGGIEGSLLSVNVPVVDRSGEYASEFDDIYVVPGTVGIFKGSIGKKAPLVYGSIAAFSAISVDVGTVGNLSAGISANVAEVDLYIDLEGFSALPDPSFVGFYGIVIDSEVLIVKSYVGPTGSPYDDPANHHYQVFQRGAQAQEHSAGAEVRQLVPLYISWVVCANVPSSVFRFRFVDSTGAIFLPTETVDIYHDGTVEWIEYTAVTRETEVEFTGDYTSRNGTITLQPSDFDIVDQHLIDTGLSFSRKLHESHAPPTSPDWDAVDAVTTWASEEKFYIGCAAEDQVTPGVDELVYVFTLNNDVFPALANVGDVLSITIHTQPNPAVVPSVYDDTTESYLAVHRDFYLMDNTEDLSLAYNSSVGTFVQVIGDYGWYFYSLNLQKLNELRLEIYVLPEYFTPNKAVTVVGWLATGTYTFSSASYFSDTSNITDGNDSTFAYLNARPGQTSTRVLSFDVPIGEMPFIIDRVVQNVVLRIKYKLAIDAGSSVTAQFFSGGKSSGTVTLTNSTDPAAEVEHDIYIAGAGEFGTEGYAPTDFDSDAYVRFTVTTVDGADEFELYYVKIAITTVQTGDIGYFYGNTALVDISGPIDETDYTGFDNGEITGTTSQLIVNPADVAKSVICVDAGLSIGRLEQQSFVVARDYYNRLSNAFTPLALASSSGYGFIKYNSESWTENQWAGYTIGTTSGLSRYLIRSNNSNTLFIKDSGVNFVGGIFNVSGLWRVAGSSGESYDFFSVISQLQDNFMMRLGEDVKNGRPRYKCCYPLFGVKPVVQARLFGVGAEAHATLPSFKIMAGDYRYTRADDPIKTCKVRYGPQYYAAGSAQIGKEPGWLGVQTATNYTLDNGRNVSIDATWIRDTVTAKLLAECIIDLYRNSPKIWSIPVPPEAINFCSWGTIVEVVGRGFVYNSDRGLEGKACMVVGYDYDCSKGGTLLVCDRAMWSYVPWDGYAPSWIGGGGE